MKKSLPILFIVPVLVLVALVFWKRSHAPAVPQGVVRIDGKLLKSSAAVWKDREFVSVLQNGPQIQERIQELIDQQPLSEKERTSAMKVCYGIIDVYGLRKWEDFLALRIPVSGYQIGKDATGPRALNVPSQRIDDVQRSYQSYWQKTFQETPLFSHVAFVTNSIEVLNISVGKIREIAPPEFTETAKQNWVEQSLTQVFDYSNLVKQKEVKVLRLFFFTRHGEIPGFIMATFVWRENDAVWLPWGFSLGIVQKPAHDLYLF